MYVDFTYYSDIYKGSILTEQTFSDAVYNAESYIRYLTYLNGDIFADTAQADAIKGAVCATADTYYTASMETIEGGNVKSESKDGIAASFVVARKDGETTEAYIWRCMYQTVRIHLLPTGWFSRRGKVGCVHDHKYGCFDSL